MIESYRCPVCGKEMDSVPVTRDGLCQECRDRKKRKKDKEWKGEEMTFEEYKNKRNKISSIIKSCQSSIFNAMKELAFLNESNFDFLEESNTCGAIVPDFPWKLEETRYLCGFPDGAFAQVFEKRKKISKWKEIFNYYANGIEIEIEKRNKLDEEWGKYYKSISPLDIH